MKSRLDKSPLCFLFCLMWFNLCSKFSECYKYKALWGFTVLFYGTETCQPQRSFHTYICRRPRFPSQGPCASALFTVCLKEFKHEFLLPPIERWLLIKKMTEKRWKGRWKEKQEGPMGGTYMSCLTFQLVTDQWKKQFFSKMYGWHLEDVVIIHSQSVQSNIQQLIPIRSI